MRDELVLVVTLVVVLMCLAVLAGVLGHVTIGFP